MSARTRTSPRGVLSWRYFFLKR
eukprot:COSAG04_NODE_10015_length_812_cov_3.708275_1_plen_22_part_10